MHAAVSLTYSVAAAKHAVILVGAYAVRSEVLTKWKSESGDEDVSCQNSESQAYKTDRP